MTINSTVRCRLPSIDATQLHAVNVQLQMQVRILESESQDRTLTDIAQTKGRMKMIVIILLDVVLRYVSTWVASALKLINRSV